MHTLDKSSYHKTVRSASMSQTSPPFPKAKPNPALLIRHQLQHIYDFTARASSSFRWPQSQCRQPCISWLAGLFWIISLKGPDATCLFSSAEKVITASWCLLNAPTSAWVDSLTAYQLLCDDVVCTSPTPCPLLAAASFFFTSSFCCLVRWHRINLSSGET